MNEVPIGDVSKVDLDAALAKFDAHTMQIKTRDPHVSGVIDIAAMLFGACGHMAKLVVRAEYTCRMAERHASADAADRAADRAQRFRLETEIAMRDARWLRHEANCHVEPDTEVADLRRRVAELEAAAVERDTAEASS